MSTIEEVFKQIQSAYRTHYLQVIKRQLSDEISRLLAIFDKVEKFSNLPKDKLENETIVAAHKSKLHVLLDNGWTIREEQKFSAHYIELSASLQSIFDDLDDTHILEQNRERFHGTPSDSLRIKFGKLTKRILFHLSQGPTTLLNLFRKSKIPISYWKHQVPFKNLVINHFNVELPLALRLITDHFYKDLCLQYLKIKQWEGAISSSQVNRTEIRSEVEGLQADISKKIEKTLKEALKSSLEGFKENYDRAGTFEFPSRKLSKARVLNLSLQAENSWARNNLNWNNTIFAFFEEWRSELDIHVLRSRTLVELESFKSKQTVKFIEQVDPEMDEIDLFIQKSVTTIQKSGKSLGKELKNLETLAARKLDRELVPKLCNKLSSQNITSMVAKLETNIRHHVEKLSEEHVIVKNHEYDAPMESEELKRISLYELISFETLGVFEARLEEIKKELFGALQETTSFANDLDQIVIFSITSARAALEMEGGSSKEATSIAIEGLKRSATRLGEIRELLKSSMIRSNEALEKEILSFCTQILDLTSNENVGELRLRITKAKAAKQAEELKKEFKEKLRARKRLAVTVFNRGYKNLKAKIQRLESRFVGISKVATVDREVSDFLQESQMVIQNLPLVYQRLYELEPTEDMELFVGRSAEYTLLATAFESWELGRYATTSVVGEKWGGLTSFINYAINKAEFKYPLTRFSSEERIHSEEGLIQLMREMLQNDSFTKIDDIVIHLNEGERRVLILENLQSIYLRKIHGFSALKMLFHLINRTCQNVFWITTTTIYTWDYLCKSIDMAEFFSYTIKMESLTEDQILSIISKRNRISGFKVHFEPDSSASGKKIDKLSPEEQQVLLQKKFFSQLNEFAKSNISLALIFWLLSTKKVDRNAITMGTFKRPDLDFLSLLSMEKLYTLHALVLHDGLDVEQLSVVLNTSKTNARLNLLVLLEDGIIIEKSNVYLVNPIVFRNIVNLLRTKNLIH
ncbi:MAG: hypothetical protein ABJP45_04485 [Cyclobacteriaceae bacterium]